MPSWKDASAIGFKFEKFILEDINAKVLPLAYKNMKPEEYSFYDIVLFNGDFSIPGKTLECKYDEMAYKTGNICIEVFCNGRESGLLKSKADYWLIGDGETVWIIEREKIRECILEHPEIRYETFQVNQEGKYTKDMSVYLIKKDTFEPYCSEKSNINEIKYNCFK